MLRVHGIRDDKVTSMDLVKRRVFDILRHSINPATGTDSIELFRMLNTRLCPSPWMLLYRLVSHGWCVGRRGADGCAERFFAH
jgi:hypothetical protein